MQEAGTMSPAGYISIIEESHMTVEYEYSNNWLQMEGGGEDKKQKRGWEIRRQASKYPRAAGVEKMWLCGNWRRTGPVSQCSIQAP